MPSVDEFQFTVFLTCFLGELIFDSTPVNVFLILLFRNLPFNINTIKDPSLKRL